jgi:mannose/fructose/N-acetylgalactosamine-specific phosphotransferase system component IID
MKKLSKKGVIQNMLPLVTSLVAVGVTIVVGFLILAQIQANTTVTSDANASAAVTSVQDAMGDIPGWLPIIVVAVIGALLLGLVQFFRAGR